jgi:ketopantoate reductase
MLTTTQTWVGAAQRTPSVVHHIKAEGTEIGLFPNPKLDAAAERARLDEFTSLLRDGGTPFEIKNNIQIQRWSKVVWNVAWNSLCTLTSLNAQDWLKSSSDALQLTRKLMREVIDVARKCDVPLESELIDTFIQRILALPPIVPSMHVDRMNGKPMEIEVILGNPVCVRAASFSFESYSTFDMPSLVRC